MELSVLIQKFAIPGKLVTIVPFGNGNINDTYLAIFRNTFDEQQVILQRINGNVFSKPAQIMENLHYITKHSHAKLEKEVETSDRVWQMPKIIQTKDGADFYTDIDGSCWRVITKIPSAQAFDTPQDRNTRPSAAPCWPISTDSSPTSTFRASMIRFPDSTSRPSTLKSTTRRSTPTPDSAASTPRWRRAASRKSSRTTGPSCLSCRTPSPQAN